MLKKLLQTLFATMFKTSTYNSELEKYIVAKKPNDVFDIERLQIEYSRNRMRFL